MNVHKLFFIKVFNVCIRSPWKTSSENLMTFVSDVLEDHGLIRSML